MAKTKYDFIKELLGNKKINQNQRERILEIASREISLEGTLVERIQKIEEIVFKNPPETNPEPVDNPPSDINNLPEYIDPYHLYKFLFEYNQNSVLRSTCHDSDSDTIETINKYCESENYSFTKHLNKIIEAYSKHEKMYYAPPRVKAMIRGYLTGKNYEGHDLKGWSTSSININWSSNHLTKWTSKHKNFPPNINETLAGKLEIELLPIEPQLISPISYEPIQNFTQLVLHFKNLFHLKSGNQSLKSVLARFNLLKKWDEKIDWDISESDFSSNIEHFTDVDKLTQAYNKLIQIIIGQHIGDDKPKVKLRYFEENDNVYLSIHHLNGKYNKSLESTRSRPLGDNYVHLINNQINGLCNFHLRADFDNGEYAKINLWDGKELKLIKIPLFYGVEHKFEFPKNKAL